MATLCSCILLRFGDCGFKSLPAGGQIPRHIQVLCKMGASLCPVGAVLQETSNHVVHAASAVQCRRGFWLLHFTGTLSGSCWRVLRCRRGCFGGCPLTSVDCGCPSSLHRLTGTLRPQRVAQPQAGCRDADAGACVVAAAPEREAQTSVQGSIMQNSALSSSWDWSFTKGG